MKEGLGPLLTIFLFFALIIGILIIYREEIQKMEFFGRLHTTAIPGVRASDPSPARQPVPGVPTIPEPILPSESFSTGSVNFGSGRIVDSKTKDVESIVRGVPLHTIVDGVTDYYARGFIEETARLYDPSPYAGSIIFLDRTTGVKESRPEREYFVLLASKGVREDIDITDWKVFDRTNKTSHKLPKAIRVLGSDGIQQQSPATVSSGDTIIVSSGRSPTGTSFLVNKCSGYRSQFKNFTPTVKTECPDPFDEFTADGSVPFTDSGCYELTSRLSRCKAVTEIPSGISKECGVFLENTLTEKGCVALHRNDADFYTPEWRLFLDSNTELWGNSDNVLYLLDENNLLVTTLVYR